MNHNLRNVSYLLGANMQAVSLLLVAWWVGDYLNSNFGKSFNWMLLTFIIAGIVIVHVWYVIIKKLIAQEKSKKVGNK